MRILRKINDYRGLDEGWGRGKNVQGVGRFVYVAIRPDPGTYIIPYICTRRESDGTKRFLGFDRFSYEKVRNVVHAGWLVGSLAGWLVGWLVGWLAKIPMILYSTPFGRC